MTSFSEHQNPRVLEGLGEVTPRTMHGIDIWERGTPRKKYKVIGFIADIRVEGTAHPARSEWDVVTTAKKHGAHAVIFMHSSREFRGVDPETGSRYYSRELKFQAIHYLR